MERLEYEDEETGCLADCWRKMCPCIAKVMSLPKCLSIIPLWPLIALAGVTVAGGFFLLGVEKFYKSLNVEVNSMVITLTQVGFIVVLVMDLAFSYSVCSNKLRIHNVHCNPEGCRGYRIKDAESCGGCCLRTTCKFYNMIMVLLNWLAFLIATVVSTIMSFSSCVALSFVALCEISKPAVDVLIDQLFVLQGELDSSPVSGWVSVNNNTNSSMICSETTELQWGAGFMVGGGVVFLVCQVIMLVSYFVASEVSWRHLKDTRKEGERIEMLDPSEAARMRMGQSQRAKVGPGGGAGPKSPAFGYGENSSGYGQSGQFNDPEAPPQKSGLPSFSGSGGSAYPPAPGQSNDGPQAFQHQSSFGYNAQTSQAI